MAKGRKPVVQFSNKTFERIHRYYGDFISQDAEALKLNEGKGLVIFNENGLLEIAIYKSNSNTVGSATTLFGLKYRDVVSITFTE